MDSVDKNIKIFSSEQDISFSDDWYEYTEDSHFWFEWRLNVLKKLLVQARVPLDESLKVLDVGGGTGLLRSQIESNSSWIIDCADLNMVGLQNVKNGRGGNYFYDVTDEHDDLVDSYDVVIIFDILEHIHRTSDFLVSVVNHIKPGGYLLVNVPALQCFFSEFDEIMGHYRRYSKKELQLEIEGLAVDVVDVYYWGMAMLPLLVARKMFMKAFNFSKKKTIRYGFNFPSCFSKVMDGILKVLMRLEIKLISNPPIGTSLMLIAQKNK